MNDGMDQSYEYIEVSSIQIGAKVYAEKNGVYYAKLHVPVLGLYVNSFTIRHSSRFPDQDLWVQVPKFLPAWRPAVETSKDNPCWLELQDLLRRVTKSYQQQDEVFGLTDEDLKPENLERNLDKAISELTE
jgi:hypothetical protein